MTDETSKSDFDVVVVGAGPGGYTAAFRAADLGLKVALVERHERLGGVCLNVGCIPSKALLHAARVIAETEEMGLRGVHFGSPRIDLSTLIEWKDSVVKRLTDGPVSLARQRGVEIIHGVAAFTSPRTLRVDEREVSFVNSIIAAGSRAATIPGLPDDPRDRFDPRSSSSRDSEPATRHRRRDHRPGDGLRIRRARDRRDRR